jgi:hypothetical protein
MAHFAEIDANNVVLRVIVVANSDTMTNGVEDEATGIAFCRSILGGDTNWVQTSYNGNMRKNYAGIGYTYDAGRNAFIAPMPEGALSLDEETCRWVMPEAEPRNE